MSQSIASKFKRKILLISFSLLILPALVVAISSHLLRWYVPHYLAKQGVKADIQQVHINWLDGRFSINQFTTQGQDNRRLAIDKLSVDWSWQELWSNQLNLSNIQIKGLRLDVLAQNNQLTQIGPIELAKFTSDQEDNTNNNTSPWAVALNQIKLEDFDICYHQASTAKQCVNWQLIDADTQISIKNNLPSLNGSIAIKALSYGKILSLKNADFTDISFANNVLAWASVKLDNIKSTQHLKLNTELLTLANGELNVSDLTLNLKRFTLNGIKVLFDNPVSSISAITTNKIDLSDLSANLKEQQGSLTQLQIEQIQADTLFNAQKQPLLSLDKINIDKLTGNGQKLTAALEQLLIDNIKLWQLTTKQRFAQAVDLQQLKLQKAGGSQINQQLEGLELTNIKLLEDLAKSDGSTLVNASGLRLDKLQHDGNLNIQALSLNNLHSTLDFDQQNGLNLSNWLASQQTKQENKPDAATSTPKPINIDSLTLQNSQITISENTTGNVITHTLTDIDLNLNDIELNVNEPKSMLLDFAATINQSGQLNAKGSVLPTPDKLMVDINGKIQHLNLTEFSAYSAQHTGYRVDQGQLSSDISVKVDKNLIDTQFDLLLSKFDLSALQQHEKDQSHKELGIPLATALNLLKDSDNNIKLSIPISGDLDNPQFSASDVISTVSFKAIKSAVLFAYSPLGFATVASGVIDLATAMRFKPIGFSPTQITLNTEQHKRLDDTAKVLKNKPQVSLVLCANATHLDVKPKTQEPAQTQELEQPQPETPIETLIELANQRQQVVKQYLVAQHNIEQHRLLLCNVKLDENAKPPKVEISL